MYSVVPQNIHTLPTEGNGNLEGRGGGGGHKEPISEGVEGCFLRSFLRGLRVRLVLFKSNSSIGYFTVNRYFKARIVVYIVDIFIAIG